MSRKSQQNAPAWDQARVEAAADSVPDFFARIALADLRRPAAFTQACLVLFILCILIGLVGAGSIEEFVTTAGLRSGFSGLAGIASWALALPLAICTTIGYFVWLIGAANNAEKIGDTSLRVSPGWQVAWYVTPFLNLIIPFMGMAEIIRHSRPRQADAAYLVAISCWFLLVLGTFGIWVANLCVSSAPVREFDRIAPVIGVTRAIALSAAALFLIVLIGIITKAQESFAKIHGLVVEGEASDEPEEEVVTIRE